jgi:hypothetical protein
MENLLINYLFTNCKALAKEFFSQEKAPTQEGGGDLDFLSILNGKMGCDAAVSMGSAVIPVTDNVVESGVIAVMINKMGRSAVTAQESIDEIAPRDQKGQMPQESEKEEQNVPSLPTQNIIALLQTHLHMKDPQETNLQDDIEKFINDIFASLQEGESVEFVKEKGNIDLLALMKSDGVEPEEIAEGMPDGSQKKPENMPLIGYLAAMFHQMVNVEKTDGKNTNPKAEDSNETGVNKEVNKNSNVVKDEINGGVYNLVSTIVNNAVNIENNNTGTRKISNTVTNPVNGTGVYMENVADKDGGENKLNNGGKHMVVIDKEAFPAFKKPEIVSGFDPEGKRNDDVLRSVQKIEVKKIDSRENLFQITTREATATDTNELNKNISVVTIKDEKTILSRDDAAPKVVSKVSDKEIDDNTGKDERQLLFQNDYTKMSAHTDKETAKVVDKTAFASMMADRIEKIAEQYGNKNFSMDMVIRLKIDDNETILVGLKDQGQRISVEVKTTNEGMGNFLQSQKEEIAKQLEGRFVYANIHVDVQSENPQKREQKEQKKANHEEKAGSDFAAFIEAVA